MFERGGGAGAFKDVLTLTSVSAHGRTVLATLTVGDGDGVLTPLEAIEERPGLAADPGPDHVTPAKLGPGEQPRAHR